MKELSVFEDTAQEVFKTSGIHKSLDKAKEGDLVYFGAYEQTPNRFPIEWYVLRMEHTAGADTVILLAKDILDCIPYHDSNKGVSWKDSYLREWLHARFLESAFKPEEQKLMLPFTHVDCMDVVTIMSADESMTYFGDWDVENLIRQAIATPYAQKHGSATMASPLYTDRGYWWLRDNSTPAGYVSVVTGTGIISYQDVVNSADTIGVRPMIKVCIPD